MQADELLNLLTRCRAQVDGAEKLIGLGLAGSASIAIKTAVKQALLGLAELFNKNIEGENLLEIARVLKAPAEVIASLGVIDLELSSNHPKAREIAYQKAEEARKVLEWIELRVYG